MEKAALFRQEEDRIDFLYRVALLCEEAAWKVYAFALDAVRARRLFCQLAAKKLNYYGAEVARYLGMTTSAVNRRASAKELPEIQNDL